MRSLFEIDQLSRRAVQRRAAQWSTPLPVEPCDAKDLGLLIQHLGHITAEPNPHGWLSLDLRTEGYAVPWAEIRNDDLSAMTKLANIVQRCVARYGTIGLGTGVSSSTQVLYVDFYLPSPNAHKEQTNG